MLIDYGLLFNMCSDALDQGKWNALKMFMDACKTYPLIALFYAWLLLRNPAKTFIEFVKTFL